MSSNVYSQHRKHTSRVGAYAILRDGQHVASVTIAYPKDGAGRLYAYVHWIGTQMVRGYAGGYGYDKRTAAIASAAHALAIEETHAAVPHAFRLALSKDDGHEWDSQLRSVGYTVVCVC